MPWFAKLVRKPALPDRHTLFHELVEAFGPDHCALCKLLDRDGSQFLDQLLYEYVNDGSTFSAIADSLGFCHEARVLLEDVSDNLGLGILYRVAATRALNELADKKAPRPSGPCPYASFILRDQSKYVHTYCLHARDETLWQRHEDSFGLCLHHVHKIADGLKPAALRHRLLQAEHSKIADIRAELDRLVENSKYDSPHPIGKEATAWKRAARKFHSPYESLENR